MMLKETGAAGRNGNGNADLRSGGGRRLGVRDGDLAPWTETFSRRRLDGDEEGG